MGKVKREVRKIAGIAHERELESALARLETEFQQWRDGGIDAFELTEAIHHFHDGAAQELYKLYQHGDPSPSVASAIARGIVHEAEVAEPLMKSLEGLVTPYRDQL